ncbi:M14 family metallopeptidase [Flagellimonas zhangzhouensis]|uniref:Zinc carboxypeptidase n=1 Tax=Flagellimonas zhangzhouensis TaxID=1073328 RepID=A0A1H2UVZ0_9FLAO|nr:M14 family metallopeptidase [Allomuricauda zhangzhouensis]SDQ13099.1 Zinc carboxypeptidase [Allomuricauda zhangzhouensis]SDW60245.1 Zinc carboxypeptidase [Allomuricauda zhangzhouensis]
MISKIVNLKTLLFSTAMSLTCATALVAQKVPSPKDVYGFEVGADYKLADYSQIEDYLTKLDAASDRVQKIEIGETVLGRKMYVLFISTKENLAQLDKWKDISTKMARATVTDAEAQKLSEEGKAIVWIDGGMHSTELAHGQMTSELAYTLATSETKEMKDIRENVITILMPVMNPDGLDIVVDWYRQNLGTAYETSRPPVLYHYYMGHDNNRDWFMNTQPETYNVTKILYNEWYPQIVYNHHQSSPAWTKISLPPYADPVNPNINPAITAAVSEVGSAMSKRFSLENMPGAIADNNYTMFWNGGGRTVPYYHNMIGILTETGHTTPTPRFYDPKKLPKLVAGTTPTDGTDIMYADVWKGGESHFRDAVDYMLTATWATLDLAADRKSDYLYNIYRMGKDAIKKGDTEGLFAYVIDKNQWDSFEAVNLINVLLRGGIEVEQATKDFTVGDKKYEKGSYVIYTGQAFRPYLIDLMEKQNYPTRFQYPGGPPDTPYDLAGWTLPLQMGIDVDRIADSFKAPTEKVSGLVDYYEGSVNKSGSFGYALSVNTNASVAATNKVLKAGGTAYKAMTEFKAGKTTFPAGSYVVSGDKELMESLADEYGLEFTGLAAKPEVQLTKIHLPKVGLYKSWQANMDEGWTRFVMDEYEFDMDTLHDADIKTKDLSKYDAIIIPSQRPGSILHGNNTLSMPEQFTGGVGLDGSLALSNYVKEGGTLIAFDEASNYVIEQFGLPLSDATERADSKDFFIPGSLIKTGIDTTNPIAFGMKDTVSVSFNRSRAFVIDKQRKSGEGGTEDIKDAPAPEVEVIATYAAKGLLMSGWAMGEERYIAKKPALVKAKYGKGSAVLFAFRPQFRAQPRGTYKLIFNAIYEAASE